jgi:two-component system response regulator QseB
LASILVVEDDKGFNETLQDILLQEEYSVEGTLDPHTALEHCYQKHYDLYVFDVNLPYENGFQLLNKLRESGDETPCIFLTSREDKASLKEGFLKGADDYMQKPIALEEFLLRVKALLRRTLRNEHITIEAYTFDTQTKILYHQGSVVELGLKPATLLALLLEHKNEVVSTHTILSRLWSSAEEVSLGSLRVYITQLKKYFPTQIQNIRGVGYRLSL